MSFPSIIPLEIKEMVIDVLAEDDKDLSSVKACSLVCRSFLPLCRKHIFASIVLNHCNAKSPSIARAICKFERLISTKPEVADYIRKLDYNIAVEDFASPSIQECLKRISRLQSFSVRHYNVVKLDWSNNPLRPALLHLLHLPTLIHFKVFAIDNFVASDLTPCINLKKLEIGNRTTGAVENTFSAPFPDHSVRLNEFVSGIRNATAIMNICTARRPDGQPVIDFGHLSKIKVVIENDIKPSQELFRRCGQLTDVYILFRNPTRICPSLASMLQPSMQTLKYIAVVLYVDAFDVDPLFSIPSELEEIRSKNIIESITIHVVVQTEQNCRQGEDWGRLDEVLMRSGWFALKRVSLVIKILRYSWSTNELEAALWKLPETQFPRLSKSRTISFKFEVTTAGAWA